MRKEEKHDVVLALTETIAEYGNFYITDTANLSVAKVNDILEFSSQIIGCT